jgi:hypothetical protein
MTLGHEKLDVYRLAIGYVAWVVDFDPDSDFDPEENELSVMAYPAANPSNIMKRKSTDL